MSESSIALLAVMETTTALLLGKKIKVLIRVLRQEKWCSSKRFKEFTNRGRCMSSLKKLLKKICQTAWPSRL